jgi:CheY-like chemotaxis protein
MTNQILRMLTAALEGAELSVLVATSGQAALDLLGHILPDLILMDAVMPGIDGLKPPRGSRRVPNWPMCR